MTTGPRLGKAEIRVDDHVVGTVDTFSGRTRARVLVGEYLVRSGNHTVTVTNLATRARPTIEIDGMFASDDDDETDDDETGGPITVGDGCRDRDSDRPR